MAFHIFRRQAVYYWRRRAPAVLANRLGRPHVSMSLRTTSRTAARRLASQLNLILDDVAMLADGPSPHLTRSQIETMLHAVVVSGKVSYAVLSFGGLLGIGDDHYPLPWQALKYDTNLGGLQVPATKFGSTGSDEKWPA